MTRLRPLAAAASMLVAAALTLTACGTTDLEDAADGAAAATSEACAADTTTTATGAVSLTDGVRPGRPRPGREPALAVQHARR